MITEEGREMGKAATVDADGVVLYIRKFPKRRPVTPGNDGTRIIPLDDTIADIVKKGDTVQEDGITYTPAMTE